MRENEVCEPPSIFSGRVRSKTIVERRIKISEVGYMNGPLELCGVSLSDPDVQEFLANFANEDWEPCAYPANVTIRFSGAITQISTRVCVSGSR